MGAASVSYVVDKNKRYTTAMKLSIALATLSIIGLLVSLNYTNNKLVISIFCAIFGFFGFMSYPLGLELGIECSFPVVPEATTSGLLMISGQIQGIVFTYLITQLAVESLPGIYDYKYNPFLINPSSDKKLDTGVVGKMEMSVYIPELIRNFCIISHINHGKTTLCDRLLEETKTIPKEIIGKQYLDKLDVEMRRGITVKAHTCSMVWNYNNTPYLLNMIDTPGHVDFSYGVWRSVPACEGAILVVDAKSGVEAQTVDYFKHAQKSGLHIIPVINKIDLKKADQQSVALQMNKWFDFKEEDILHVSAKCGTNVEQLLNELIVRIPAPRGDPNNPFLESDYQLCSRNINKLLLNYSAVHLNTESHPAFGKGFRFDTQVIILPPSVPYKVKIKGDKNIKKYGREELIITNALELPNVNIISEFFEPMVIGTVTTPENYSKHVSRICLNRRGVHINTCYSEMNTTTLSYKFPLSEIIIDFNHELKAVTSGYASFVYKDIGYESTDLVKLDILLNDKPVNQLSHLVNAFRATTYGKNMCAKLKNHLKRHQFDIKIEAAIGDEIVAREDIKAYHMGSHITRVDITIIVVSYSGNRYEAKTIARKKHSQTETIETTH
ncbi:unnamed protein product [Medioppia subpectinata]|uniref:Tr-type G domain-containing protein n=1 Tax=Medioppia subpectinata TaxID=1979941 RepID=A0A7R9Q746_9ACAR|nr:unnamed protein product [Medioppia subpectinata]CAG2115180.1 unnamed protein product [Medioppia subpectinata]